MSCFTYKAKLKNDVNELKEKILTLEGLFFMLCCFSALLCLGSICSVFIEKNYMGEKVHISSIKSDTISKSNFKNTVSEYPLESYKMKLIQ